MGAHVQGGASPKGTAAGPRPLSSPVWLWLPEGPVDTAETAETMLMLRRGLSLKIFRKRADDACPREKAKQ